MRRVNLLIGFILINVSLLLAQNGSDSKFFPLRGNDLRTGRWILIFSELEKMSKAGDAVKYTMDNRLLYENRDSLWIVTEDSTDCSSKTAAYRVALYHNLKQARICSYCYPEQIGFGTLLPNLKNAILLKEIVTRDLVALKKDSIIKDNSHELISVVRIGKGSWKISYLHFCD